MTAIAEQPEATTTQRAARFREAGLMWNAFRRDWLAVASLVVIVDPLDLSARADPIALGREQAHQGGRTQTGALRRTGVGTRGQGTQHRQGERGEQGPQPGDP